MCVDGNNKIYLRVKKDFFLFFCSKNKNLEIYFSVNSFRGLFWRWVEQLEGRTMGRKENIRQPGAGGPMLKKWWLIDILKWVTEIRKSCKGWDKSSAHSLISLPVRPHMRALTLHTVLIQTAGLFYYSNKNIFFFIKDL